MLCCAALAALPARAHSLQHAPVQGGIGVRATYDDGAPSAFSAVQVFAPGETQAFAEGMTDRDGSFTFRATTTGVWRLTVDDGMGHALAAELPVTELGLQAPAAPGACPRAYGVLAGLGLIFGGFGVWALARARKGAR